MGDLVQAEMKAILAVAGRDGFGVTAGGLFTAFCRADRVVEVLFSPDWGRIVCAAHHKRQPSSCGPFIAEFRNWLLKVGVHAQQPREDVYADPGKRQQFIAACRAHVGPSFQA